MPALRSARPFAPLCLPRGRLGKRVSLSPHPFVKHLVLRRTAIPRPILLHPGPHHLPPDLRLVAVARQRSVDGLLKCRRRIWAESESGRRLVRQRLGGAVGDRVVQTADGPHDRHRAVAQAVKLIQAADGSNWLGIRNASAPPSTRWARPSSNRAADPSFCDA